MFTGIVEEIGTVETLAEIAGGWSLTVRATTVLEHTRLGDSLAINGACLTVTNLTDHSFTVGLSPETLRRTNLGDLKPGDGVNLERSLALNGRLGGHFVQGHIDGTGVVRAFHPEGDSLWVAVAAPAALLRYIVPKGYIAVDGTSLTVVDVLDDAFTFMLVAYTQQHITLPRKSIGSRVNLEVDMLSKYVEKFMHRGELWQSPVLKTVLADLQAGRFVIIVDDEDRENEGDLVIAAEYATPQAINFMAREGRGLICVAMTGERLDALQIPLIMPPETNTAIFRTAFTVPVEARHGVTTGISAFDRATTIRTLIDPDTRPEDLVRPGHVFPLRAADGGVLSRAGHTEASVDLARMAGLYPAAVICEIMRDDGAMARRSDLERFAARHGIRDCCDCRPDRIPATPGAQRQFFPPKRTTGDPSHRSKRLRSDATAYRSGYVPCCRYVDDSGKGDCRCSTEKRITIEPTGARHGANL
jgi:riboflavin synthase alpha subunit